MINYTLAEYESILKKNDLLLKDTGEAEARIPITHITCHSGKAGPGSLFLCKGAAFREAYLAEAVKNGAVAYVSEKEYEVGSSIPVLLVRDMRRVLFLLAEFFYGDPSGKLCLTGVTGTKGKTTTTYYLKAMLDAYLTRNGQKMAGLLGSVEYYDGKQRIESSLTTPEALELYEHLGNAVEMQLPHLIMEVSSQALKYHRLGDLKLDTAVFLNISEDHISPKEHKDFEDYFQSKLLVFSHCRTACVNLDSDYSDRVLDAAKECERIVTFGTDSRAVIRGSKLRLQNGKICFDVIGPDFREELILPVGGIFNVENALAAAAVAWIYGIPSRYMREGLLKAKVPGRMEIYQSEDHAVTVIVDYAHNGLSFRKIFDAVELEYQPEKITAIFGCPGGKAYNRRRDLGCAAGERSDLVVLVPDDPGPEDPLAISEEICGYVMEKRCPCRIRENRGEAIHEAVLEAVPGEVILVLGKGVERTMRYGQEERPCFTDGFYVRNALEEYNEQIRKGGIRA